MDALSSILRAVSDPTRRTILDLLESRSRSVNDLAQHFSMSRPAVSKHLGILREAGLVSSQREGRQQIYEVDVEPLVGVREWLAHHAPESQALQAPPETGARPAARANARVLRRAAGRRRDDWRCW